ncbi:MAG: glycoside hydrolase family 25 protein [Lachnospiraceae bacterium]|nr:glycoside hydrolase family 25 protein [Lachnospiraceae bacterium]
MNTVKKCALIVMLALVANQGASAIQDTLPLKIHFVDAFGEAYEAEYHPEWPQCRFEKSGFVHDGDSVSYVGDDAYTSRLGIDVSYHQRSIDWNQVKDAGYEFVIIRVGYRGYGKAGNICGDTRFAEYVKGARNVGLDVGVYFFSQAINEEEAVEEAEFCLQQLESVGLTPDNMEMPVVYDPESILDAEARTDNVTGEQFTANSVAFCERIKEEGYEPMIYANMKWEAFLLDLSKLSDYPFWYADYEEQPQTPYDFSMWQYSNTASVPGVSGECDVDVQLIPIRK